MSDLCLSARVWNPCNQPLPPPLPEPGFAPDTQDPLVTVIFIRGLAGSQAQTLRKQAEKTLEVLTTEISPTTKKDLGRCFHPDAAGIADLDGSIASVQGLELT